MCCEVATSRLYAVGLTNCRKASVSYMTVMGRRSGCSSSNSDIERCGPEAQDPLHDEAKRLAAVFQRSSANVEGRNGYLSLRSHQLRGLDLPRKRQCFSAIHNFFLTRPDGTTAAERFFGQKPRSMFAAILASVELPPAPLSPPRRA